MVETGPPSENTEDLLTQKPCSKNGADKESSSFSSEDKPCIIEDYEAFLSTAALRRYFSFLRVLVKCMEETPKGTIFLAGGLPNAETFPIVDASFTLRDGTKVTLGEQLTSVAMQYGVTQGYKPLLNLMKEFMIRYHHVDAPELQPKDMIMTGGGQDAVCKVAEAILNEGDYVILESAAYPGTTAMLAPLQPKFLLVEGDGDGMKPESLRSVLSPWTSQGPKTDLKSSSEEISANGSPDDAQEKSAAETPPPKLLIVCPSGGNPTGSSATLERKKEIYKIARKHNLLILEDDPYFFVQFGETRIPSYLSMDVDGRVIRVDSFSKIVSAGMRLGWVTGPFPIMERILMHSQVTVIHPPLIVQIFIHQMLTSWGWEKFDAHLDGIRKFYLAQKDAMMEACNKHLSDLAEWEEPRGGMFVWLKIKGVSDTLKMCMEHGFKEGVVPLPGCSCTPYRDAKNPYIRLSFSQASPEDMEKAAERLRIAILKQLEAEPTHPDHDKVVHLK